MVQNVYQLITLFKILEFENEFYFHFIIKLN